MYWSSRNTAARPGWTVTFNVAVTSGVRTPGDMCITTRTVCTCPGSTRTFRAKLSYPAWRTSSWCSPGSKSTFLFPFNSFRKPTYSPSTQTPESLSTFEAPSSRTSPMTLLLCDDACQATPKKQRLVSRSLASRDVNIGSILHLIGVQAIQDLEGV